MSMADKIGIHWFRLDLRLNDNPSLIHLTKEVDKIIPVYICLLYTSDAADE